MTDELLYERLALSVMRMHSPLPHVHRDPVATFDQVYPLLIAPFFAGGTIGQDLHAAHIANAFVMTAAVVPVDVLPLRVTHAIWPSVVAGVLPGTGPWMPPAPVQVTKALA